MQRWLRKPPGIVFIGSGAILLVAAFYYGSFPGGAGIALFLFVAVTGQALAGIWLARVTVAIALTKRGFFVRRSLLWAVPPVLVLFSAASVVTSVPLRARFQLSQDAMDAFARDVVDGSFEKPRYVGLWPVGRVKRVKDGEMRFLVRGAVFLDEYGFAYSPNGKPRRLGEDSFMHIEGPWYLWEKSW